MPSLRSCFSQALKSAPVLVAFAIGMLYLAMIAPYLFSKYVGVFDANQMSSFIYLIFFSLACFFAIPALACKFIFKEPLKNLGLRLPQGKTKTLLLIVIALIILMPFIYLLTQQPHFIQYYTMKQPSFSQLAAMIFLFPIYYFGEEFFFRGFLFLGLWHKIRWHSFWITEIIFTLSHIGKPGLEILLCIPASVVFNCLTLSTRSFYPALIVHFIMGSYCLILVNIGHL